MYIIINNECNIVQVDYKQHVWTKMRYVKK